MLNNYDFLDAHSSILTARSSITAGSAHEPIVTISSVLSPIPTTFSGSPSISGAVTIVGNQSVSGTVNIGNAPSVYGNISGSVVATQGGSWVASVSGRVDTSMVGMLPAGTQVIGSVAVLQGTSPWNISSIYGNISGSVVSHQGTTPWVVGSVVTTNTVPGTPFRFSGSIVSASVTLIAGSVSGQRHYITDFRFANTGSVATLITFQDGSTSIVGYTIAPSGSGSNFPNVKVPDRTNPSQDLAFKPGTAVSILYATVNGYTI